MAEDSDQDKTEEPSGRRIEKAREEGDVPRSKELTTCAVMLGGGLAFMMMGGKLMRELKMLVGGALTMTREEVFDITLLGQRNFARIIDVIIAMAPILMLLLVIALTAPIFIGGWIFSEKALAPNFGKLNPLNGIKNMFSVRSLIELIKAIGKATLVGSVVWLVVGTQLDDIVSLGKQSVHSGVEHLGQIILITFIASVASLIVIAAADIAYQLWHYKEKLKMTKEEVKQEYKEMEGNPEIKGKIRQLQREAARKRMMAEVPKADVVVTNPTHFAVALSYKTGMKAPVVVAKGRDIVAAKIREIAEENKVPLFEAPPLARALYAHTELGNVIDPLLYTAVANVLAYVIEMRHFAIGARLKRPEKPSHLDVPSSMDPQNPKNLRKQILEEEGVTA